METGIMREERRQEDEDEEEGVEADYDVVLHAEVSAYTHTHVSTNCIYSGIPL